MNSNGVAKRAHKHNNKKRKYLIDYMHNHPEFAAGRLIGVRGKEKGEHLWNELTKELNCRGCMKNKTQWQKVWKDSKTRVKSKAVGLKNARLKTGNFPIDKDPLSEEDLKILGLVGSAVTEGCMVPDSMPEEMSAITELREANESVLSHVPTQISVFEEYNIDPTYSTIDKREMEEREEEEEYFVEALEEYSQSQLVSQPGPSAECVSTEHDIDKPSSPQTKPGPLLQQKTPILKIATHKAGRLRKKKTSRKDDVFNKVQRIQEKQNEILETMSEAMLITAKNKSKRLNIEEEKLEIKRQTCQALNAIADAMTGP